MNSNRRATRSTLARARRRLMRRAPDGRYLLLGQGSANTSAPLPPGAAQELSPHSKRLGELRQRYVRLGGPWSRHTLWTDEYRDIELDLTYFRGDNAFVWQQRHLGDVRLKLYLYLRYLEDLDTRGLLRALGEDGAFGCWTYDYVDHPRVSRDLLDSVNELYFLDRVWGLFENQRFSVLDIGAGYGRLAHRMAAAAPGLDHYYCLDAVPEATFACEYYLHYRGLDGVASAVPLDELDRLPEGIDLAVNVHSFSEMSWDAIGAWLELLARLDVPNLLVVPNEADGVFSMEPGGRRPADDLIRDAGYELVATEPIFLDPNLPDLLGVPDRFFFSRRGG